jgi:hypothetical protein
MAAQSLANIIKFICLVTDATRSLVLSLKTHVHPSILLHLALTCDSDFHNFPLNLAYVGHHEAELNLVNHFSVHVIQ